MASASSSGLGLETRGLLLEDVDPDERRGGSISSQSSVRSLDSSRKFAVPEDEAGSLSRQTSMGAMAKKMAADAANSRPTHPPRPKLPSNVIFFPFLKKKDLRPRPPHVDWHLLSQAEILRMLDTNLEKGLTDAEAEVRCAFVPCGALS